MAESYDVAIEVEIIRAVEARGEMNSAIGRYFTCLGAPSLRYKE